MRADLGCLIVCAGAANRDQGTMVRAPERLYLVTAFTRAPPVFYREHYTLCLHRGWIEYIPTYRLYPRLKESKRA